MSTGGTPFEMEANGFRAAVIINGRRLQCHGTTGGDRVGGRKGARKVRREGAHPKEASCWIASRENETFTVELWQWIRYRCVAQLYLDGRWIASTVMPGDGREASWDSTVVDGYRRPFTFTSQSVGDDEALLNLVEDDDSAHIGEIKIRVSWILSKLRTGMVRTPGHTTKGDQDVLPAIKTIHESHVKATKAPHQITLGMPISEKEKRPNKYTEGYIFSTIGSDFTTFTFRYKPLDILIDQGIVPQLDGAATPPPTEPTPGPRIRASLGRSQDVQASPMLAARSCGSGGAVNEAEITESQSIDMCVGTDEVALLEDEERALLAQLESVRNRKRKAMNNLEDARKSARKVFKKGPSTPPEVIDLT